MQAVNNKTFSPKEAAEFLGMTVETMAIWRCTGRYPLPFVRIGRRIRYRVSDLENFVEQNVVDARNN